MCRVHVWKRTRVRQLSPWSVDAGGSSGRAIQRGSEQPPPPFGPRGPRVCRPPAGPLLRGRIPGGRRRPSKGSHACSSRAGLRTRVRTETGRSLQPAPGASGTHAPPGPSSGGQALRRRRREAGRRGFAGKQAHGEARPREDAMEAEGLPWDGCGRSEERDSSLPVAHSHRPSLRSPPWAGVAAVWRLRPSAGPPLALRLHRGRDTGRDRPPGLPSLPARPLRCLFLSSTLSRVSVFGPAPLLSPACIAPF